MLYQTNPFLRCLAGRHQLLISAKSLTATNKSTTQFKEYSTKNKSKIIRELPDNRGNFKLSNALLVTKLSRYEVEQHRNPELNKFQLEELIRNRGTDYEGLLYYHRLHKEFEKTVAKSFHEFGINVQSVNRLSLTEDKIRWADILIPIGGDGTYLLTASRSSPFLPNISNTPVVGFNSDPIRSEGKLMLTNRFSKNPSEAVEKILKGAFKWKLRSRIRMTLYGQNGNMMPQAMDLHEHEQTSIGPINLPTELLNESDSKLYNAKMKRILPYLALNEVFIGETLSARVSHLQISVDDPLKITKTKSSGLCVSTGTGSTSWLTSINRLSVKNVENLLNIVMKDNDNLKQLESHEICDEYNRQLIFPADDQRLCYSLREQICVGVWPNPKGFESRGFAQKLLVKSRCVDAGLVIDGSIAYPFNDGAKALLEVHPNDSLLTISIDD